MFSFFKKEKTDENKQDTINVDFKDIEPIIKYFQLQTGINFDNKKSIIENKTIIFCRHRNIYSFEELLNMLKSNYNIKQELINYLTTNETFFYREFYQIETLLNLVKTAQKKVDILCAPSSTGEEPYSIAMALLEGGVEKEYFNIIGIDINSQAIDEAKKAIYQEKNLRNVPIQTKNKYFTQEGNHYKLNQTIKSLVTFKVANIFDESFKNIGKFDYIFSRNMLIYFDKPTKQKAINILESLRKNENIEVFWGHADLF